MNLLKAILLKLISAFLFAVMSVLVRYLGETLSGWTDRVLSLGLRRSAGA